MDLLELPGWRLAYDRVTTSDLYARTSTTGPETCTCDPCRNWAATRDCLLPSELCQLLQQLGIPADRECEVYHNCRLESGLHSYGAWYHFVGRVLYGELECSPNLTFERFHVWFHSKPVLLPEPFVDHEVAQMEIEAEVPWLSDVPESS
jgi:hypothetical protein